MQNWDELPVEMTQTVDSPIPIFYDTYCFFLSGNIWSCFELL